MLRSIPVFVHDSAERQTISPAGGEVVDIDIWVPVGEQGSLEQNHVFVYFLKN